ncbi:MAG: hypothetical protein U0401_02390 [Anaerolineae bacterium]
MNWLLQIITIWISLDIVLVATAWYAVKTIKPLFPNWWKQVVIDIEPAQQR